jgi:transcription initiation factor IIE alpha subunit
MPEFESYVDVDPSDFVSACSKKEIKELIVYLVEDGHITSNNVITEDSDNLLDTLWKESVHKLFNSRLQLTEEEETIILKITNKL